MRLIPPWRLNAETAPSSRPYAEGRTTPAGPPLYGSPQAWSGHTPLHALCTLCKIKRTGKDPLSIALLSLSFLAVDIGSTVFGTFGWKGRSYLCRALTEDLIEKQAALRSSFFGAALPRLAGQACLKSASSFNLQMHRHLSRHIHQCQKQWITDGLRSITCVARVDFRHEFWVVLGVHGAYEEASTLAIVINSMHSNRLLVLRRAMDCVLTDFIVSNSLAVPEISSTCRST